MSKVIINGKEVKPTKKVKLTNYLSPSKIKKIIKKKQQEQK